MFGLGVAEIVIILIIAGGLIGIPVALLVAIVIAGQKNRKN